MSVNPDQNPSHRPAVELKSSTITVPVLKLSSTDMDRVAEQISRKISQAPDFFRGAPMIVDLHDIAGVSESFQLATAIRRLREEGLIPIGVRGGDDAINRDAAGLHLAVMPDSGPEPRPAPTAKASTATSSATRLITQPIRSGQRIYAAGDLIILAQVSAGAEIMADGNIHVYSTLRGRALAGVKGDLEARIFCSDLQAELVSIAGHYRISENIDSTLHGMPLQIYLDGDALIIDKL